MKKNQSKFKNMRDFKQIMHRIGSKFAKTNWRDWRSLRFSLRGHLDPQKRSTNGEDPRGGVEERREGEAMIGM